MERKVERYRFMTGNLYANLLNLEQEWAIAREYGYVQKPYSDLKGRYLADWNNLMVAHADILQVKLKRIFKDV